MKTQIEIAEATKKLILKKDFNQISVTNIMTGAGLRRQTFYDFYHDKYDVLAWIYQTEVNEAVSRCEDYATWPETLVKMLTYFNDNREFYQKVIQIDEQNAPEEVIESHIREMVGSIFNEMILVKRLPVDEAYQSFCEDMLSAALISRLEKFLSTPAASIDQEAKFMRTYIEDGMNGLISRIGNQN
ncbi:dihydroxyacetone kinase transcriptional activator DhaS [Lentilactobacillus sp. Marseille-Q4993]|uniref:dihydroxyacetone kinase transcriptional activator DhaS n=1 Tax=Lentilactobacillus sp. Marseille-Q4993 TaxID=3039492 RepID=UPI0024BC186D|nr:dihydroxyacetone kinase transcriptional activator DhaS [Lentilactobacillus sp. Marseille-Q4993]